ncbi:MAG: hypothetical protein ACM30G_18875 [Micromonosporaceae bacterium]
MTSPQRHAPRDEPEKPPQPMPGSPAWPGRVGWVQNRRRKVVEEIERNRRGEYRIPTWVLAIALGMIVATWAAVIVFA